MNTAAGIIINRKYIYSGASEYEKIGEEVLSRLDPLVKTGKFEVLAKQGDFILFKRISR